MYRGFPVITLLTPYTGEDIMKRLLAIFISLGILLCSNALYAGSGRDDGAYVFPSQKRYMTPKKNCFTRTGSNRFRLRSQPQMVSETTGIANMVYARGFYHYDYNKFGKFLNNFKANPDGTVTARATGLVWQAAGSDEFRSLERAHGYIEMLNRDRFAGYSDWRLPTVEELASLVQEKEYDQYLYINTQLFGKKQKRCWSADGGSPDSIWYVSFMTGRALWIKMVKMSRGYSVRAVRSLH